MLSRQSSRVLARLVAFPLLFGTCAAFCADLSQTVKPTEPQEHFQIQKHLSEGSVTAGGVHVDYQAVAGTLVVHAKGWDDVAQNADKDKVVPEASVFYVAYFAKNQPGSTRPITFFYNGGPGSSSVWLHMGGFGPRRVVTADHTHTRPAPYKLVENTNSLLDVSDLVFIDAPGTGFSRIAGKDKEREKAFYGVDADAHAFADFIVQFLSRYERWNSPKFLFGESYGTTRNAVLANMLQDEYAVDLNGVINLSQINLWSYFPDQENLNPGVDETFVLDLPTYAATAWYHHALPEQPAQLAPFLEQVEHFADGEYLLALQAGSALDPSRKAEIAHKLHLYTGLPEALILKADLRIPAGVFEKHLRGEQDITVGRLDARFAGPSVDPLGKDAEYDPQSSAISSAYVAAFNGYARTELHVSTEQEFKPEIDIESKWDFAHQAPGTSAPTAMTPNVMVDLAHAMKHNPLLKVMFNAGYYDLATPFYATVYERNHLALPSDLRDHIELNFYESGHMVYANSASHQQLHEKVATFIQQAARFAESN